VYQEDQQLVARMRAGEQRAFDAFFTAYAQRLAAFAARRSRLDAASVEDVVQNSLIKAVRNLAGFRGEAALFSWLCKICRHELADIHRKSARRPAHDSVDAVSNLRDAVMQLQAPSDEEPHAQLESAARNGAVVDALNALPEHYALALEMKYGDGLSVEDIGHGLGLTTIAAQSLLARARAAFRERWQGPVEDENTSPVYRSGEERSQ
jgi:RNA polymerase sigma-70 factor (ECF subfamily)